MRFCLKPNTASTDPAARIGYCLATGLEAVQESAGAVPGFAEARQLEVKALKAHLRPYREAGLDVAAMGLGQVTPEVVLGKPEGKEDFARICHDVETIAEAGVGVLISVVPVNEQPTEAENQEQLKRVADYYQRLCAVAERAGVRIATHSPWPSTTRGWLWGTRRFAELFAAAPSPANGYLYDNAIHHMLGDDPAAAVRQFADRIFFVHIRDVRKSAGAGAAGTGYDEVFPGTGSCDLRGVLAALHDIDYTGVLCPEHFPIIPGDTREATATAYAVGYFRGVIDSRAQ